MERSTRLTKIYSQSLYDVLNTDEQLCQETMTQYKWFLDFLDSEKDLAHVFESPSVSPLRKKEFIEKTLRGKCRDEFVNFLHVLVRKGRFWLLSSVYEEVQRLIDGTKTHVEITTAIALSDEQKDKFTKEIEDKVNEKISLKTTVDPQILGGMMIRVDDTLFNGSLKFHMDKIKDRILERSRTYGI